MSPAPENEFNRPAKPLIVPAPPAEECPFVWRCLVCSRRERFGHAELERFMRDGWPVCCGETVLAFLAECEPGGR
jgi:hypothetical protein